MCRGVPRCEPDVATVARRGTEVLQSRLDKVKKWAALAHDTSATCPRRVHDVPRRSKRRRRSSRPPRAPRPTWTTRRCGSGSRRRGRCGRGSRRATRRVGGPHRPFRALPPPSPGSSSLCSGARREEVERRDAGLGGAGRGERGRVEAVRAAARAAAELEEITRDWSRSAENRLDLLLELAELEEAAGQWEAALEHRRELQANRTEINRDRPRSTEATRGHVRSTEVARGDTRAHGVQAASPDEPHEIMDLATTLGKMGRVREIDELQRLAGSAAAPRAWRDPSITEPTAGRGVGSRSALSPTRKTRSCSSTPADTLPTAGWTRRGVRLSAPRRRRGRGARAAQACSEPPPEPLPEPVPLGRAAHRRVRAVEARQRDTRLEAQRAVPLLVLGPHARHAARQERRRRGAAPATACTRTVPPLP